MVATTIGLCLQGFVVGPKFKGVKMLPPGPHMVSYNAASRTGDFAPTISFFTHLETREVLIRRWDAEQELLIELHPDEVLYALDIPNLFAPHILWLAFSLTAT